MRALYWYLYSRQVEIGLCITWPARGCVVSYLSDDGARLLSMHVVGGGGDGVIHVLMREWFCNNRQQFSIENPLIILSMIKY